MGKASVLTSRVVRMALFEQFPARHPVDAFHDVYLTASVLWLRTVISTSCS
jgi:hypothetical protein